MASYNEGKKKEDLGDSDNDSSVEVINRARIAVDRDRMYYVNNCITIQSMTSSIEDYKMYLEDGLSDSKSILAVVIATKRRRPDVKGENMFESYSSQQRSGSESTIDHNYDRLICSMLKCHVQHILNDLSIDS